MRSVVAARSAGGNRQHSAKPSATIAPATEPNVPLSQRRRAVIVRARFRLIRGRFGRQYAAQFVVCNALSCRLPTEYPCAPSEPCSSVSALLIGLPAAARARPGARTLLARTKSSTPAIASSAAISRGLASVVERAFSTWGQPNGYVLGQEGGGAFIGGLRYGEGTLYTKNAGDLKVYWQGPSLGWDIGGEGARTMMLIYNLPGHARDLSAFRRRRRLGLYRRRRRHDGADRRTASWWCRSAPASACGSAPMSAI